LQLVIVEEPDVALGIAVRLTLRHPAFANQSFSEWAAILANQAQRGHQLFAMDAAREVRGFFGYALASEADAFAWAYRGRRLSHEQCVAGDCIILNAWLASDAAAQKCMVRGMRQLARDKRALYFKRHYADGRVRVARLAHPS
jgi:hemolysin-activating ACP:hemolysin acyltransferase